MMHQTKEHLLWYHGRITRDAATHLLNLHSRSARDGCFLVRDCSSAPGDYVLSMWAHNQVLHFQVHCNGDNRFSVDDGPIFHGLDTLVTHYQNISDGLPCRLTTFCRGELPPAQSLKFGVETLLHRACAEGNIERVKILLRDLSSVQEINARNEHGLTPLLIVAGNGINDIVSLLLKCGADIKASSSSGMLPLQEACATGHCTTAEILLNQGHADVQERSTTNGWVPLHEAAMRGHIDCIELLLSYHASMHPRSLDGDTPRDLSLRYNQTHVVEFLDNYPIPPPRTSVNQWLHQNLDRKGAVTVLNKHGLDDGKYMIRTSIKCHGYYILSVGLGGKVYHFQIKSRNDRWYYIDDGPLFETLPHLVDHYSTHIDGLPVLLQSPVPQERPAVPLPPRPSVAARNLPTPPKAMPVQRRTSIKQENNDISFEEERDYNKMNEWQGSTRQTSVRPPAPPPTRLKGKDGDSNQQTIINQESLELGQELGQGEFGSVLMGVWKSPQGEKISVALKTLHEDKVTQGEQEFLREARVMSNLNHPCIVRLLGVCLGPPMVLVQELVTMGALLDYLIDHQDDIKQSDLKLWAGQIACGMMYLEDKKFVHRDLATRNLLLLSKEQVKISDFGLSRAVGAGSDYYQAKQGGRWPVKWYAPESINYGTFSHKSDVWSYGVTLWEMYTFGELPYGEMAGAQVIAFLERGQRMERPDDCPSTIYELMLRCWDIEPAQRPSFKKLYEIFKIDPDYGGVRPTWKGRK